MRRRDKAAVNVAAFRAKFVVALRFQNQIGFAQSPAACIFRNGWRVGERARFRALVGPLPDHSDLVRRENVGVMERFGGGFRRFPGRHKAGRRDGGDLAGPLRHVPIRFERERRDLAGMMASGAVLENNRGDVAGERQRSLFARRVASLCGNGARRAARGVGGRSVRRRAGSSRRAREQPTGSDTGKGDG